MIAREWLALDIQGTQSPDHRERGIARYIAAHAQALSARRPGCVDCFLVTKRYTLSPAIDPLLGSGRVTYPDAARRDLGSAPGIFHVMSPFELNVPVAELWPNWARRGRLVVTLYDLIPLVFADQYLGNDVIREQYEGRLALVRQADLVLAISESTRRDAIEVLGLPPERVVTIGAGVGTDFKPAGHRRQAEARLKEACPEIRPGFIFYTGGADSRKNMVGLVRAYGRLAPELRAAHQLVITCRLTSAEESQLAGVARDAGVVGDVILTNFVTDETLKLLYQTTGLFVFPSLYEGYGLPIAEAMACGAPVIAAESSSLVELVTDPRARFDPADESDLAHRLSTTLTSPDLLDELRTASARMARTQTWEGVANRTLDALAALTQRSIHRHIARRCIALVTPYPPQLSGIASYSAALADELAETHDVHVFVDGDLEGYATPSHARVKLIRLSALPAMRTVMGYDSILYCLGNSEFHAAALDMLQTVPGAVLAHDVRLTGLYGWRSRHGWPKDLSRALAAQYASRLPSRLQAGEWIDPEEAAANGIWLMGEVIKYARSVLVHSHYARDVVLLERDALGLSTPVAVVPFGFPDAEPLRVVENDEPHVVSFGLVAAIKQPMELTQAFGLVRERVGSGRLVFVGPCDAAMRSAVEGEADRLGCGESVDVVGEVSPSEYLQWLSRADVCVQLRAVSQGEASLTVAEAMAAGLPTVVTAAGWMGELPDETVVKVGAKDTREELVEKMIGLLRDPDVSARFGYAARNYAKAFDMASAATHILKALDAA